MDRETIEIYLVLYNNDEDPNEIRVKTKDKDFPRDFPLFRFGLENMCPVNIEVCEDEIQYGDGTFVSMLNLWLMALQTTDELEDKKLDLSELLTKTAKLYRQMMVVSGLDSKVHVVENANGNLE